MTNNPDPTTRKNQIYDRLQFDYTMQEVPFYGTPVNILELLYIII